MATIFIDPNRALEELSLDLPPRKLTPAELFQQAMQLRAQQARSEVGLRQQEQMDNGIAMRIPDPFQATAIDDSVRARLRQAMMPQPAAMQLPAQTRALPGLGNVAMYPQNERVVTSRYGVGSATNDKSGERFIMEGGKKVSPTAWFQEAAKRQGESNKFANKEGRKIVDDKKVA